MNTINRRELIATALVAASLPLKGDRPRVRPWAKRAAEMHEEHGPYADYAAWEEWWWSNVRPKMEWAGDFDISCLELIVIYGLMRDLADGQMPEPTTTNAAS